VALALGGCSCGAIADALAYLRHGLDDIEDLTEDDADYADVHDRVPTLSSCLTAKTTLEGLRAAVPAAREWLRSFAAPHYR
jgi:hypothetical protein